MFFALHANLVELSFEDCGKRSRLSIVKMNSGGRNCIARLPIIITFFKWIWSASESFIMGQAPSVKFDQVIPVNI